VVATKKTWKTYVEPRYRLEHVIKIQVMRQVLHPYPSKMVTAQVSGPYPNFNFHAMGRFDHKPQERQGN